MQLGQFQQKRAPVTQPPKYSFLTINHKRAWFESPDGDRLGSTLDMVILGQLRSRIMWPGAFGSKQPPVCKSDDSITGIPKDNFPWDESMFSEVESNKQGLPCEKCKFKEWDKDFGRARCQETWTIPVLLCEDGKVQEKPLLLNLTSSGITTLRDYFTPMIAQKTHPFTYITKVKLRSVAKGVDKNPYAKPEFAISGETDPSLHNLYVSMLREIKAELRPKPLKAALVPIKLG